MRLRGRTVLLTGGTSGIGLELARQLSERGNTVVVTGRDEEKLQAARKALPALHTYVSDVSDPAAIVALAETVLARFPELDTLINNAGVMRNLDLRESRELTDITREIEINLNGPVRMVQQFLAHLKGRKEALIVNVSSGLAFVPLPAAPVYCAAKAALHAYTRSLRAQLEGTGVQVVELAPPAVGTPLFHSFSEDMQGQKSMPVEILAQRTIAAIEAGKLEIRPGLSNVLHAMSRLAPGLIFRQLAKMGRPKPTLAVQN